jgi:predicted DCC family thiol-disulfide oxidoreductase YuxK
VIARIDSAYFGGKRTHETIFYDGECGLCHGWVRLIVTRDNKDEFRYAPLQGKTFERSIPPEQRASLPDSIVLLTSSGELLVRSSAAIHVLWRLGGPSALLAALLWVIPKPFRNGIYDHIARNRKQQFAPPADLCPVVPENLRGRFLP